MGHNYPFNAFCYCRAVKKCHQRFPLHVLLGKGKGTEEQNRTIPLEGSYNDPVWLPDSFGAYHNLKHCINGIVKMPLNCWGINHICKNPVPGVDHHLGEEVFLHVKSKPPRAIPVHPDTGAQEEETSQHSLLHFISRFCREQWSVFLTLFPPN